MKRKGNKLKLRHLLQDRYGTCQVGQVFGKKERLGKVPTTVKGGRKAVRKVLNTFMKERRDRDPVGGKERDLKETGRAR